MDGFEHFDQQERSWAHLQEHGPRLAKEAAEVLSERPEGAGDIAGVIVEMGATEWRHLRTLIEQSTGQEIVAPLFVGIVPRHVAVTLAGANAGVQAQEWLEANAPAFLRKLPVVVATKDGFRMGALAIPESGSK